LREAPSDSVLRRFRNAACNAALKVGKGDNCSAFLNVLKDEEDTFLLTSTSVCRLPDGSQGVTQNGKIVRVCEAAADYCEKRIPDDENTARLKAAFERLTSRPVPPLPPPAGWQVAGQVVTPALNSPPAIAESTAQQLHRLKDECHWTAEDLADKAGMGIRSVQRHLAGKMPLARNITAYELAFSKRLKRNIVIKKMA
jgi:hypothetical protein